MTTGNSERALLLGGALAGPLYVVAVGAQALTRPGFDLRHHAASLLSNGDLGWVQVTTFILTGALVVAGAAGLRRVWGSARWAPVLIAGYGFGLVGAGLFRADPAQGFPLGTPDGPPATVSWHGLLHFVAGGLGFLCLVAACLVIARRFRAAGERGWAAFSAATGVLFLAAFAGIASGSGAVALNLSFAAAVLLAFGWLSLLMGRLAAGPAGQRQQLSNAAGSGGSSTNSPSWSNVLTEVRRP